MESTLLKTFVVVAECRSFSKAAMELGTNQSTVSRHIMALEAIAGVNLFDRVARRVALSSAGEQLLEAAHAVLNATEAFSNRSRELASGEQTWIRLGATIQTIQSFASPLSKKFCKLESNCSFDFVEGTSEDLIAWLEEGKLHLALASDPGREPFVGRKLFQLQVDAFVPKSNPLADRSTVDVGELIDERLLLMRPGYMTRNMFDRACRSIGRRPKIHFESHSPQTLAAVANDGHGIALIPSTATGSFSYSNLSTLRVVHRRKPLTHWMSVLWDSRRRLSPAEERFISFLTNTAAPISAIGSFSGH